MSTIDRALGRGLTGDGLSEDDALLLALAAGPALDDLCAAADELRRTILGEQGTYVVNRNINFTNVCVMRCGFCAFSRTLKSDEGYYLPISEVARRAAQAQAFGATEVCIQAGLVPRGHGRVYAELVRAVKAECPDLHLHAFSPEEVRYAAKLSGRTVRDVLSELKDAGLGSLPGTSAEILDDELRSRLAPGRISVAQWTEVIREAHALGLPTTSTMMFGHIETPLHRVAHLLYLRRLQAETGGFTEFVPLGFVHQEAPMFHAEVGARPGATLDEQRGVHALARLVFGRSLPHIQVSWVKVGFEVAAELLRGGVDDVGGTLMNESISTTAGASHGQVATPARLRGLLRSVGRRPVERDTRYRTLRVFDGPFDGPFDGKGESMEPEARSPLDDLKNPDEVFGSYAELAADPAFRYRPEVGPEANAERARNVT